MSSRRDQHELDRDTTNQSSGPSPGSEIKEKSAAFKSVMTLSRSSQTEAQFGSPFGAKVSVSPESHPTLKTHTQPSEVNGRFNIKKAKDYPSYPLERPVKTDKSVAEVTKIVDDLMKNRSVEAKFSSEDARAICVTSDFLKYHVNLYIGTDESTVVEVQRRKGCSLSFRKERMALVNALEGKARQQQNVPVLRIPPELIEEMGGYPSTDEIKSIIENCIEQIHSKNHDGILIAYQHLASMTDPEKSSMDSAAKAALIIMDPASGYDTAIMNSITTKENSDEFFVIVSNACLTIFANCLKVLSSGQDYNRIFNGVNSIVDQLLPSLLITVRNSILNAHSIHNSCLAMRCILTLLEESPNVRETLKSSAESTSILEHAVSLGKMNHANLEEAAKEVIRSLHK